MNKPYLNSYFKGGTLLPNKFNINFGLSGFGEIIEIIEKLLVDLCSIKSRNDLYIIRNKVSLLGHLISNFNEEIIYPFCSFPKEDPSWVTENLMDKEIKNFIYKCNFLPQYDLENNFLSEDLENLTKILLDIVISLFFLSVKQSKHEEDLLWSFITVNLFQEGFAPDILKGLLQNIPS